MPGLRNHRAGSVCVELERVCGREMKRFEVGRETVGSAGGCGPSLAERTLKWL